MLGSIFGGPYVWETTMLALSTRWSFIKEVVALALLVLKGDWRIEYKYHDRVIVPLK